jgi:hypothetical protein
MVDYKQGEKSTDKGRDSVIRVKRIMNAVTGFLPGETYIHDSIVDSGSGDGVIPTTIVTNVTTRKDNKKPTEKVISTVSHATPKPRKPSVVPEKKKVSSTVKPKSTVPPTVLTQTTLPGVVAIGAKCAGTNILTRLLEMHPQINIVNNTFELALQKKLKSQIRNVEKKKVVIDMSASLFSMPFAPQQLSRYNPSLKLILMLRDPIDRCLACFHDSIQHTEGSGARSIEDYVLNSKGKLNMQSSLVVDGAFDIHLVKWLKYFDMSHWLFLDYFQLTTQPYLTLKRLEKFLNVQPFYKQDNFVYNKHQSLCLSTKFSKQLKMSSPLCLQTNSSVSEVSLGADVEDQLKEYFTPRMERSVSLISKQTSLADLASLN